MHFESESKYKTNIIITNKQMAKKKQTKGLSGLILAKVRKDVDLQIKIKHATGKSFYTVQRWLAQNHEYLALPACLNMICAEYGITQKQALA